MDDNRHEAISRLAYDKWENAGRPVGEHERHWHEAEEELNAGSKPTRQTRRTVATGRKKKPTAPARTSRNAAGK